VLVLAAHRGEWTGLASELLGLLREIIQDPIIDVNRWPKSPMWLSEQLRRADPQLRMFGVMVTFQRTRTWWVIRIKHEKLAVTAPS
jgi:hypothetical protein